MNSIDVAWQKVRENPKLDTDGIEVVKELGLHYGRDDARVMRKGARFFVRLTPSENGGDLWMYHMRVPTTGTADEFREAVKFQIVAIAIAEAYSEVASEEIEKRKAERERIEREAAEQRAKIDAMWEEREQRLLTEFIGDSGRIRVRGSTTFQPVIVSSREVGDKFVVDFEWVNSHDIGRNKNLRDIRIFDVKVGSRYREVWNDGRDDLPDYKKLNRGKVKKYDS